jgi:hypothetical protein
MSPFVADYLLFVFWACVGAIQIGASIGRFDGLLFVRHNLAARALGVALIFGAIAWFFLTENRNINDTEGGLDANQQAMGFFAAAIAAVIVTVVISSFSNAGMHRPRPGALNVPEGPEGREGSDPDDGLDALRRVSYLTAVRRSLPPMWRGAPGSVARFYSGDKEGIVFRIVGGFISRGRRG